MIIIRLFEILRHPNTSITTKRNMAMAYFLRRHSYFIQKECIFLLIEHMPQEDIILCLLYESNDLC